jgi:hypothetical protein
MSTFSVVELIGPTAPAALAQQALTAIDALVLPPSTLPQNSFLSLRFADHQLAIDAMEKISPAWSSPNPDSTIPTTLEQRRAYVRQLLLAFLNRDDIKNAGKAKRWNTGNPATGEDYLYTKEVMEKVCWDMVDIAVRLHTLGPSSLPIHDKGMHDLIKQDRMLTFEQRRLHLREFMCFFKSRCEDFMKGTAMVESVAAPKQKLRSCLPNKRLNLRRAVWIKNGQEAQEARKMDDGKAVGLPAAGAVKRGRNQGSVEDAEPNAKRKRAE